MKVLVTGAAGRVGANVVKRLVMRGIPTRAMVMPGDPLASKLDIFEGLEVAEADLTDQTSVDGACAGVTHVVHLAAQMGRGATPVDRFYDVNTLSTLRLFDAARRLGSGLKRFVLASTDSTYRPGAPPAVPLTEDTPQAPSDYYGTSKLLGEILLRNQAAQWGVSHTVVRFSSVVSPEEAPNFFTVGFWRGFLSWQNVGRESTLWPLFDGKEPLLPIYNAAVGELPDNAAAGLVGPDGSPWTLSVVDVRDAAEGVCLALSQPSGVDKTFNISSSRPTTHAEGASAVSELRGVKKVLVKMPMIWRLEVSIERAARELGYSPRYDFSRTIKTADNSVLPEADRYIPLEVKKQEATTPA
jgi:UDP-glucose 4-epimerase